MATIQAQLLVGGILFLAGFGSGFKLEKDLAEGAAAKLVAVAQDQYAKAFAKATAERDAERDKHARLLAENDAAYQESITATGKALEDALRRAHSHGGGLYVNAKCPATGSSGVPQASSGAGSNPPAERIQLSEPDGDFLINFADEADRLADQLRACQAVVRSDRE